MQIEKGVADYWFDEKKYILSTNKEALVANGDLYKLFVTTYQV